MPIKSKSSQNVIENSFDSILDMEHCRHRKEKKNDHGAIKKDMSKKRDLVFIDAIFRNRNDDSDDVAVSPAFQEIDPKGRVAEALKMASRLRSNAFGDARISTEHKIEARAVTRASSAPYVVAAADVRRNTYVYTPHDQWAIARWKTQANIPPPDLVRASYESPHYVPCVEDLGKIPWHFAKGKHLIRLKDSQIAIVCSLLFAENRSVKIELVDRSSGKRARDADAETKIAYTWGCDNSIGRRVRCLTTPVGTGKTIISLLWGTSCALLEFNALRSMDWVRTLGWNGAQSAVDSRSTALIPLFIMACPATIKGQVVQEALSCAQAWRVECGARVEVHPRRVDELAPTQSFKTIVDESLALASLGGCVVLIVTNDSLRDAYDAVRRQRDGAGRFVLPVAVCSDEIGGGASYFPDSACPRVLGTTATPLKIADAVEGNRDDSLWKRVAGHLRSWSSRSSGDKSFESALVSNNRKATALIIEHNARFMSQDVASVYTPLLIEEMRMLNARGVVQFHVEAAKTRHPITSAVDRDPTFKISIDELYKLLGMKASPNGSLADLKSFADSVRAQIAKADERDAPSARDKRRVAVLNTLALRLSGEEVVACPICADEMTTDKRCSQLEHLFILPCCSGIICEVCKDKCIDAKPECPRCRTTLNHEMACDQVVMHDSIVPIARYEPTCASFADLVAYVQSTDLSHFSDNPVVACSLLDEACSAGISQMVLSWNHSPHSRMGEALHQSQHDIFYLSGESVERGRALVRGASARLACVRAATAQGKMSILIIRPDKIKSQEEVTGVDLPGARLVIHTGRYSTTDNEDQIAGRILRPSEDPRNNERDKMVISISHRID